MNGYPSPDQWRQSAATARQHANDYRRDADAQREPTRSQWLARADDCDDRADDYEWKAQCEEYRLAHLNRREAA